jgi:hypothetical protein
VQRLEETSIPVLIVEQSSGIFMILAGAGKQDIVTKAMAKIAIMRMICPHFMVYVPDQ